MGTMARWPAPQALAALRERELHTFEGAHPRAAALTQQSEQHWQGGVPFHWMRDWPLPYPVFVRDAVGATLHDVDGYSYDDFCLGDTGAMFGHSPPPVARALAKQAAQGLTAMLPGERVAAIGKALTAQLRPAVLADDADRDRCQPLGVAPRARSHRPQRDPGVRRLLSRHGR